MKNHKINKIFGELKRKGLVDGGRKLKEWKNLNNSMAFPFTNNIFYDPKFSNLDINSLRFILLHEEAHFKLKNSLQITWVIISVIISLFLTLILKFFVQKHLIELASINNLLISFFLIIFYLIFYLLIFILILNVLKPIGKKEEFLADEWAVKQMIKIYRIKNPTKLIKESLYHLKEKRVKGKYHGTHGIIKVLSRIIILFHLDPHPSIQKRVKNIQEKFGKSRSKRK